MSSVTVDAKWLASHLDSPKLVIVDARGSIPYSFNHVKNARSLVLEDVTLLSDKGASLVIGQNDAESLFSSLGINDSKQVVVYGETMDPSVGRIVWTLMYHGHTNVGMLEIGFSRWVNLGFPVTREVPMPPVMATGVQFKSKINPTIRANAEYIRDRLVDPNTILLDARSAQEHSQATIPGSILDNWEDGAGSAGQMLKSKSLMEKDFERKGIPRQSEIICFCHAGVRASHKYLQLKQAGYERVKVYDGSIIDWAKRGYPIR